MSRIQAGKKGKPNPGRRRSASVEPDVASYLRAIGFDGYQEPDLFWGRLEQRHGAIAKVIARAIAAREAGEEIDVYALKSTTLDLSIDVTAQYCGAMYPAFLSWYLRERYTAPRVLLDVGCDNGILTCFYAGLYPDADVVGIDRCAEGIACARELGKRLHVPNVRFEVRELHALAGLYPDASVDCIISATVFHEVLEPSESLPGCPRTSIGEMGQLWGEADAVRVVAGLAALLREETGIWISMERWPDAARLAWWIGHLRQAGLRVVIDRSTGLTFPGVEQEREMLPIVVATRNRQLADRAVDDLLAHRIFEDIDETGSGRRR